MKKIGFDESKHCGAKKRKGGLCTNKKGTRTQHIGQGRCWLHGGIQRGVDRRVKTGLFTPYLKGQLAAAVDHASKFDLRDLTPHLQLLNGLLNHFVELQINDDTASMTFLSTYGGAINTIIRSTKPEEIAAACTKLKESANVPRGAVDVDGAAQLVERISRVVEKIHRMEQTSAVTLEAVNIFQERLAMVVFKHVKDDDTLEKIKRDWSRVELALTSSAAADSARGD